MMIELSWSVEGEKQISRRLNLAESDLGDLTRPMAIIGAEMLRATDSNFSSRGALFGEKWKKRKDKKPHPLLEKTGRMRNSFDKRLGPGYVEIYNTADYFKYHQSNKPRSHLPRRVMLKIDQARKVFIIKTFQRHVMKSLRDK